MYGSCTLKVPSTPGFVEEIGDELAEKWETMTRDADREIRDARVRFRWQKPQIDVIKRAAARFGIPYQTYIKQAAFRQALADLKAAEVADEVVPSRK